MRSSLDHMSPFFTLAGVSPSRQISFRLATGAHLLVLAGALWATHLASSWTRPLLLGNVALVAGIVEGALLVGWRLTQLPKSQALEFLLVSQFHPGQVFRGEAAVGLARLGLVTLAGLPLFTLYAGHGWLHPLDLPTLVVMPFCWGAVAGLGLTAWAYEPPAVRRWGERLVFFLVLVYLLVGVLAAEHLPMWLHHLPEWVSAPLLGAFKSFHTDNPFGVMKFAMENAPAQSWNQVLWSSGLGMGLSGLLVLRAGGRFQGHFQDEHYRPIASDPRQARPKLGEEPLAWWAVKRVTRFSGRINLWLALGFAILYGIYTVAETHWPPWLGREVFLVFERLGGIPVVTTALVLLAAVPAAFQYGVWDSSPQDRVRRLELLLLTDLDGAAYWRAAAAAAWRRGRGYLAAAALLWLAALGAGRSDPGAAWLRLLGSLSAGVVLWGLYFAIGFWAFTRGRQAGGLGLTLTLGVPLATYLAHAQGWDGLATVLPPGGVVQPWRAGIGGWWLGGMLMAGGVALWLARNGQARCLERLRGWYNANHGLKAAE